jgi:hypothetical protein
MKDSMSLEQMVSAEVMIVVNKGIKDFVTRVANAYDKDPKEIQAFWSQDSDLWENDSPNNSTSESPQQHAIDHERILKALRPELVGMCKEQGLSHTGTKAILMKRLLGKEGKEDKDSKSKDIKKAKGKKGKTAEVLTAIATGKNEIKAEMNDNDNYTYMTEEGIELVFVKVGKNGSKVIGKEVDDIVVSLTPADINICNRYKLEYDIPENLDTKTSLDDVEVEEMDESDDDIELDEDDILLQDEEELDEDDEEFVAEFDE